MDYVYGIISGLFVFNVYVLKVSPTAKLVG